MTTTVVRAACPHDCPDTCAMLVTVENGVATKVRGDPAHPTTAGVLCTKVARYTERTYHPERLLYPMKRVGPKGSGQFQRVGWDEALDRVADGLAAARGDDVDLLIVDRQLPDGEGLDLIERFRAEGRRTPALVLSALGSLDDRVRGLRAQRASNQHGGDQKRGQGGDQQAAALWRADRLE